MFRYRIKLFSLMGFKVHIDISWFILAFLIVWSLAQGYFPAAIKGLSTATYWWMGVLGALGLFGSIVLHELGHAYTARRHGIPMKGITLFIFGGVAEMGGEPPNPKAELWMAAGGPLVTFLLIGVFWGATALGQSLAWPPAILGVLGYLAGINLLLLLFNLVPAFPLDGGRILRAGIWWWRKSLPKATWISSRIGIGFSWLLIALGIWSFLTARVIGGVWWVVLGLFLRSASEQSYQQTLLRHALDDESLERFIQTEPLTVSPTISIQALVNDYIYRYHTKRIPVVEQGELVGCVSLKQVKKIPQKDWEHKVVRDIIVPCEQGMTLAPEESAFKALTEMSQQNTDRLFVVKEHRLLGIVRLKDLIEFVSLKLELEGEREGLPAPAR